MREAMYILRRYGPATAFTTIALILTLVLGPFHERFPYVLLAGAVVASALQGGLKPGLFATSLAVGALTLRYLLFDATGSATTIGDFLAQTGLAVFVGVLASYLGEHCWRAVRAAEWMQTALGSAGEAVIFTDADGNVTFLNSVAQEMLGWGPDVIGEKRLDSIFKVLDSATRQPLPNPLERAVAGRMPTHLADSTTLVSRAGNERPVMGCVTPILDRDGNVEGAVLVFRDLSEFHKANQDLRQNEERYRSVVASLPVGMLLMDPQGRCVEANRMSLTICGTAQPEALGEGWVRYVHPEEREHLVVDWADAVRKGTYLSREVRFITPQGPRVVLLRATPVKTDKDVVLGHVGTLEDVSDYKHREDALALAHSQASKQVEVNAAELARLQAALNQVQIAVPMQQPDLGMAADELKKAREQHQKQLQEALARLAKAEESLKDHPELLQQLQAGEAELARLREEHDKTKKHYEGQLKQHSQHLNEARKSLNESEAGFQKKLQQHTAELTSTRAALQKRLDEALEREKKAQQQAETARKRFEEDLARKTADLAAASDKLRADLDSAVERELQAEDALLRESRLWKCVLDNLDQGVAVWDSRGLLTFLNRAGREQLGFEEQVAPPDNWARQLSFLQPDGKTPVPLRNLPLFNGKRQTFRDQELVVVTQDEQRHNLCVSGRPLADEDGHLIGATVTFDEAQEPRTIVTRDDTHIKLFQDRVASLEAENLRLQQLKDHVATAQAEAQRLRLLHQQTSGLHAEQLAKHQSMAQDLAEATLRAELAEERLQNALDCTGAILWEADAHSGQLELVSRTAETLLGYPVAVWEERGSFGTPLLQADDRNRATAWFHRVTREGINVDFECRALTAEGQTCWLRVQASPVRNESGNVVFVRGIMLDITERQQARLQLQTEKQQAQQLLHEAERRGREHAGHIEQHKLIEDRLHHELRDVREKAEQHLRHSKLNRALANSLGTPLITVDGEDCTLFVNPAAERLLGWRQTDVLGRSIHEWLLFPSTEDQQADLTDSGRVVREDEVFGRRDGGMLRVHCTETPLLVDQQREGTIITFHQQSDWQAHLDSLRRMPVEEAPVENVVEVGAEDVDAPPRRERALAGQLVYSNWLDYN